MSKLLEEEEVEVVDEVLVAASVKKIPPPKNWVLLLGVKVTVEAMVGTVGRKGRTITYRNLKLKVLSNILHVTHSLKLTIE